MCVTCYNYRKKEKKMDIQRVYSSERKKLSQSLQRSLQVVPFYPTHQESRQIFWQSTKKRQAWRYTVENQTVYFVVEFTDTRMSICNLLAEKIPADWGSFFKQLESCGRYFFKNICELRFEEPLSSEWHERLLLHRYETIAQQTGQQVWRKKLNYCRGLVLGGGGAHGAYQIGVWKALKEKNLAFEIITGTSVGALNGVLILQNDLDQAISLWNKLTTSQVMRFPKRIEEKDLRKRFIQETRQMARSALVEGGNSIAPLENLLRRMLEPQKILDTPKPRLFTVATRLPDFTEVVTPIQQLSVEELADWILASAAFYPAMAYRKISGSKYIDGGYRNNLPVDVAIQHGATECFVVDINGPGITKKITPPTGFVQWTCTSLWSLGGFLIFDSQRNQMNIQLGYLETKKVLGDLQGKWYTFFSVKEAEGCWRKFLNYLRKDVKIDLSFWTDPKFWRNLRKLYKDRVVIETCGLAMLELLAKKRFILPNKVYHFSEMVEQICTESVLTNDSLRSIGQLNAEEWQKFQVYKKKQKYDQTKQATFFQLIKNKEHAKLQSLLDAQPIDTLMILYLYYLKEEQRWHKNFPMKS